MRTRSLKRSIVCCFFFAGILCTGGANGNQEIFEFGRPLYRFFNTREYQADTQNWAAVEDQQGLLLFGNDNLVLQYDGQRWEHVRVPGGLAIKGLAVNDRGEIWVGGAGQLGRLVREGDRYRFLSGTGEKGLPTNFGEVGQIVRGVEPQELRDNNGLRQHIAGQLAQVETTIDAMIVDQPRRRIIRSRPATNGENHASAD